MAQIISLFLFIILGATTAGSLAQSSPAAAPSPPAPAAIPSPPTAGAPAPSGPTNVTKILEKAGQFTVFIRMMKSTSEASQLYGQLNDSSNGITIFAPSDSAFSGLKSGTLNSLSSEQQTELVQFHVIPSFISSNNFQTVSNPLRTQAGDSAWGHFQLNVTTTGTSVNITTGVTNSSVTGTVYTDGQLAIYQVNDVLLPQQIFDPLPPAPAPAPEKSKKKSVKAESPDGGVADASIAVRLIGSVAAFGAASFWVVSIFFMQAYF